jgi:hypothetical protein
VNPSAKPTTNQKQICVQFGCQRTHNEQVIVAPSGMILAQETFCEAEAVSTIVVSSLFLSFPVLTLFGLGNDKADILYLGPYAEPHFFR